MLPDLLSELLPDLLSGLLPDLLSGRLSEPLALRALRGDGQQGTEQVGREEQGQHSPPQGAHAREEGSPQQLRLSAGEDFAVLWVSRLADPPNRPHGSVKAAPIFTTAARAQHAHSPSHHPGQPHRAISPGEEDRGRSGAARCQHAHLAAEARADGRPASASGARGAGAGGGERAASPPARREASEGLGGLRARPRPQSARAAAEGGSRGPRAPLAPTLFNDKVRGGESEAQLLLSDTVARIAETVSPEAAAAYVAAAAAASAADGAGGGEYARTGVFAGRKLRSDQVAGGHFNASARQSPPSERVGPWQPAAGASAAGAGGGVGGAGHGQHRPRPRSGGASQLSEVERLRERARIERERALREAGKLQPPNGPPVHTERRTHRAAQPSFSTPALLASAVAIGTDGRFYGYADGPAPELGKGDARLASSASGLAAHDEITVTELRGS